MVILPIIMQPSVDKSSFPMGIVALWPIAMVAVWAIWNLFRDSSDEKQLLHSLNWPEAQGTITSSEAVWGHYEVRFEYSLASKRYRGALKISMKPAVPDRYAGGARQFAEEAQENLKSYAVGTKVVVRYNPKKPSQSVLFRVGETSQRTETEQKTEAPDFFTLN